MKTAPPEGGRKLSKMTMAQVANETPIDFKGVAAMFPRRPSAKLMYQWRTYGILNINKTRVRLEWFSDGGQPRSTVEAVVRFQRGANGE